MNVKYAFTIILLFLILFSAITFVSADDNKSYTIEHAIIELTISNSGLLHVNETYHYSFDGSFQGVYRDIPLKNGESIENINVTAKGAYPVLEQSDENGQKHLKIRLYSDEAHTQGIKDCDVDVTLNYDMKNVVTVFNDVGGLQYNLWGKQWDADVGGIDVKVNLPGKTDNQYFITPNEFNKTSNINENTINAEITKVPKGELVELLVIMPHDDFKDSPNAKHTPENGKDNIMKNHEQSVSNYNFWHSAYIIFGLLTLLSPLIALFTYLKFGREPKVDYEGVYERELPTEDHPAVVNALYSNKVIGEPNMDGFEATVLSLIDKKIISLETKTNSDTETKDLFINFDGDTSELDPIDVGVYNTLYVFAEDDVLNLSDLNERLSSEFNARLFMQKYNQWQEEVRDYHIGDETKESFFDGTGRAIIIGLGMLGILYGIIIAILGFLGKINTGIYSLIGGIFIIIFSIIIMYLKDDTFGRWTEEGRIRYLKWRNFRKFLKDNSLIEEHPPESIVIWRKYLIYGAAMGVADNVYKAMKLQEGNIPDYYYNDDIFLYHHFGGYYLMSSAFTNSQSSLNSSSTDFGDFGDFGGGSGGGGGGAF